MECGLKKLRAPSATRIRTSSMIQNTQTTGSVSPHWNEFYGKTSGHCSLLSEIRVGDSDNLSAEGDQEGVYVL